jgi:uncharacterized protein involved in exopolysaccharide biosynthesis
MALENNQIDNTNIDNDEISLKELIISIKNYLKFLKTKFKIICVVVIISFLTGYIYSKTQVVEYKAVMTFILEEEKPTNLGGAMGLASQLGLDLGGGGGSMGLFIGNNLISLMKSRILVQKALLKTINIPGKNSTLADFYLETYKDEVKNNYNLTYNQLNDINKLSKNHIILLREIADRIIKNNLTIQLKEKKNVFIDLIVISREELFSKLFCETISSVTTEYYTETKSKKARINLDILQKQADSIRNELNNSISSVAKFNDMVYNLNPSINRKRALANNKQIDVQANTAIFSQIIGNLEFAKVSLRKETPLIQVLEYPNLPLDKIQSSPLFTGVLTSLITSIILIMILSLTKLYSKIIS